MTWRKADHPLTPEELTAYVDGELDGAARDRVAARLDSDAAARGEVESQQRLMQLLQAAAPPEPGPADWSAALAGIEARLPGGNGSDGHPPRRPIGPWIVRIGLAAASIAASWLLIMLLQPRPEPVEPYAVVSPHDVEILSMDDADAGALVVGVPPLPGPWILADAGDITVESMVPAKDSPMPLQVGMAEGPHAPMIVAPLGPQP